MYKHAHNALFYFVATVKRYDTFFIMENQQVSPIESVCYTESPSQVTQILLIILKEN
jgi:hypothetical protein